MCLGRSLMLEYGWINEEDGFKVDFVPDLHMSFTKVISNHQSPSHVESTINHNFFLTLVQC